jgi:RimJ/RimL family protein N-acetyltransferase
VELRAGGEATGICGLIKRDTLEDVDIGYAFLPRYRGRGYALEASRAALAYGRDALGLRRIVAITDPDNDASARLLGRLGLEFSRMIIPPGETRELKLFAWNA